MSLSNLVDGYNAFRKKYFGSEKKRYARLVKYGQKPKFLVVACSDSRVDPALLLNCEPGDLFVIRNVANLIPPYEEDNGYHGTIAALEFGICYLGIKEILVLGHTKCGGIIGALDFKKRGWKDKTALSKWVGLADAACTKAIEQYDASSIDAQIDACGKYALMNSYTNLLTFPWISDRLNAGNLVVHLWNFDLSTGLIECYDFAEQSFKSLYHSI